MFVFTKGPVKYIKTCIILTLNNVQKKIKVGFQVLAAVFIVLQLQD